MQFGGVVDSSPPLVLEYSAAELSMHAPSWSPDMLNRKQETKAVKAKEIAIARQGLSLLVGLIMWW